MTLHVRKRWRRALTDRELEIVSGWNWMDEVKPEHGQRVEVWAIPFEDSPPPQYATGRWISQHGNSVWDGLPRIAENSLMNMQLWQGVDTDRGLFISPHEFTFWKLVEQESQYDER